MTGRASNTTKAIGGDAGGREEPHRVFVGRAHEIREFMEWMEHEPTDGKRVALIIGQPGRGKSALLRRFERLCDGRPAPFWHAAYVELNDNETAAAFLERLLKAMHAQFRGRMVARGPNDARHLTALLKAAPHVGDLLSALVADEHRPAWMRFADYLGAAGEHLAKRGERLVLLVDPNKRIGQDHVSEWLSVAERVPPNVRIVIAQRSDDVLASHGEWKLKARSIPASGKLGDLDRDSVRAWYEAEFTGGRLAQSPSGGAWDAETRRGLADAAHARYGGYPLAHDAVIRLIASGRAERPVTDIQIWPQDVNALMDMLFDALAALGDEQLRAGLALQVFGIPAPLEAWAKGSGVAVERLMGWLASAKFRHFFDRGEGALHAPFHALFGERLSGALGAAPRLAKEVAEAAWGVVEPALDAERLARGIPPEFELLAASKIASWFGEKWRFLETLDRVTGIKRRLGYLDAAAADYRLALERYDDDPGVVAVSLSSLGQIARVRGNLGEAEQLHRKSLEIEEKLGRMEGMVSDYSSLGLIAHVRGNLDEAERLHRKSLELSETLGNLEGMAVTYGNLGLIARKHGDLDEAERLFRKSMDINEKLNRPEWIAAAYGNLGLIAHTRGNLDEAEVLFRNSLEISERLGLLELSSNQYGNLGVIAHTRGNLDQADRLHRKSLEINEKLGRLEGVASDYGNLGVIARTRGDLDEAEGLYTKSLDINETLGLLEGMANAYSNLGLIAEQRGRIAEARQLWTKARDLFAKIGMPHMVKQMEEWLASLPKDDRPPQ